MVVAALKKKSVESLAKPFHLKKSKFKTLALKISELVLAFKNE